MTSMEDDAFMDYLSRKSAEYRREKAQKEYERRLSNRSNKWQIWGAIASIIAAVTGIASVVWNVLQYLKIIRSC